MKYLAEYCINKLGETNCTIIALLLYIVIWLILLNLPHYVKYIDEKVDGILTISFYLFFNFIIIFYNSTSYRFSQ